MDRIVQRIQKRTDERPQAKERILDRIVTNKKTTQKKIIFRKEQTLPAKEAILRSETENRTLSTVVAQPAERIALPRQSAHIPKPVQQRQISSERPSQRRDSFNGDNGESSYVVDVKNLPPHFKDHRQLLDLLPRDLEIAGIVLRPGCARLEFNSKDHALDAQGKVI